MQFNVHVEYYKNTTGLVFAKEVGNRCGRMCHKVLFCMQVFYIS